MQCHPNNNTMLKNLLVDDGNKYKVNMQALKQYKKSFQKKKKENIFLVFFRKILLANPFHKSLLHACSLFNLQCVFLV